MYLENIRYSDELYHHGIKGQRWGVRRFQNDNGTLTEAGVKRYGRYEKKLTKIDKKVNKLDSKKMHQLDRSTYTRSNKRATKRVAKATKYMNKEVAQMRKGIRVLNKMERKLGNQNITEERRIQGQAYLAQVQNVYNQKIILKNM